MGNGQCKSIMHDDEYQAGTHDKQQLQYVPCPTFTLILVIPLPRGRPERSALAGRLHGLKYSE
jgi:hypothetical protein